MKRYCFEEEAKGKVLKLGLHYLACTEEELKTYQDWKSKLDAEPYVFEEITPGLRRYMVEFANRNFVQQYKGAGWITMTKDENHFYIDWVNRLKESFSDHEE